MSQSLFGLGVCFWVIPISPCFGLVVKSGTLLPAIRAQPFVDQNISQKQWRFGLGNKKWFIMGGMVKRWTFLEQNQLNGLHMV